MINLGTPESGRPEKSFALRISLTEASIWEFLSSGSLRIISIKNYIDRSIDFGALEPRRLATPFLYSIVLTQVWIWEVLSSGSQKLHFCRELH